VIRFGTLLLLLLLAASAYAGPAFAQPVVAETGTAATFNAPLATAVYSTALSFMAPRTLDAVAVSQLTVWGLHGLTALDPDLAVEARDGVLRLSLPGRPLASAPAPTGEDPAAWAAAAVG